MNVRIYKSCSISVKPTADVLRNRVYFWLYGARMAALEYEQAEPQNHVIRAVLSTAVLKIAFVFQVRPQQVYEESPKVGSSIMC